MGQIVLIDGQKQTKLSVLNRLVQFGDGLFETCLFEQGEVLFWSRHFERLTKGCDQLHINTIEESAWLADINKALQLSKLNRAVVKIILSRGESARGYGYEQTIEPVRIVIVSPVPSTPDQYELSVCSSGYANNQLLSEIKHCNRLEQILARSDLQAQECIMLDDNGYVISVTQGNIFAIRNQVILTPGLDECGIEGTRRSVIFSLAERLNLSIEICSLSVSELLEADEVFITNSVIGIKPVVKINEQEFSQHQLTSQLTNAFSQLQEKKPTTSTKPFKKWRSKFATLSAILLTVWLYWANTIQVNQPLVYQLSSGDGIYTTASKLRDQGVVHSSYFVIALAKLLSLDSNIKSGHYDVRPDMSVVELLENFSSAKVATRNVILVEGKTVESYYQYLKNNKALASQYSFEKTLILAGVKQPYEGYFWPDTYQINYGDSVLSVFQRAAENMQRKLQTAWEGRAKNHPLKNKNQALVLASLVEKETANTAEKSKIAGVFIRRLQQNMRLQTDPSVVYALGDQYQGRLSKKDLAISSPYNTYRNKGLPPGPISSVSDSSLHAAMHPQMGDALYFVSKKDGTHAFAKTYKQHRHNINKYLKNL